MDVDRNIRHRLEAAEVLLQSVRAQGDVRHAALLAIDRGAPGIYNITEPNEVVSSDKAREQLGWSADFRLPG